jgi:hypothetical protein
LDDLKMGAHRTLRLEREEKFVVSKPDVCGGS